MTNKNELYEEAREFHARTDGTTTMDQPPFRKLTPEEIAQAKKEFEEWKLGPHGNRSWVGRGEDFKPFLITVKNGEYLPDAEITEEEALAFEAKRQAEYEASTEYKQKVAEQERFQKKQQEEQNLRFYGIPTEPKKPDAKILLRATQKAVERATEKFVPVPMDDSFRKFATEYQPSQDPKAIEIKAKIKDKLISPSLHPTSAENIGRSKGFDAEATIVKSVTLKTKIKSNWPKGYTDGSIKIVAETFKNEFPIGAPFETRLSIFTKGEASDEETIIDEHLSVEALVAIRDMLSQTIEAQKEQKK